jgi:hypothetical protein
LGGLSSGGAFSGLFDSGLGDLTLIGVTEAECDTLACGWIEAEVLNLLNGFPGSDCPPFCSKIPIKLPVGGIGLVSKAWSKLALEESPLRTLGDLEPYLGGIRISARDIGCFEGPVRFGDTDAEREAARFAAMNEVDLD